jgi:hypothetical protein
MALHKPTLTIELRKFLDLLYPGFTGAPVDINDMANKWGDALDFFALAIHPTSSNMQKAKNLFIESMKGLNPPLPDQPYYEPFTLGYRSDENCMYLFNTYLNQIGYRSNPALDQTENFTIIKNIRLAYNKQNPSKALTDDAIFYNQARHNEIYAPEIANGTVEPLQVDGIIGDDTILYKPTVIYNEFQRLTGGGPIYNSFIAEYGNKTVAQSATSGDIGMYLYVNGIGGSLSKSTYYNNYVKSGLAPDYLNTPVSKTQSDPPNTDYLKLQGVSNSKPFSFYKSEFERNHFTHDPFWRRNGIFNITTLNTFMKTRKRNFDALPSSSKDPIQILQNSLQIYALSLAQGMAPEYTAVPPPTRINLIPVGVLGAGGASSQQCVELLANLIYAWFRTGTAVKNSTGAPSNWN